ncbi:MarR family winged helix-turn-helix transcriptional regulator [Novosphingobium sp.]|uniref:MarR family winged helix-turn-helix transcriptional regulator n=1 Tax=Novosphingobium sp. TaxID=1874826 RepID=UPI002B4A47F1|nr:MarR family transcriptional regulator [Novosphingobium sp.]HKR91765.1 MarR family transcriptional regulator [Novosphingobium sp.]
MARPRLRNLGSPTRHVTETWARERPDLDPNDYLFLVHTMRLGQLIERLHDSYARKEFGLSGSDIRVLMILRRSQFQKAPKAAELAEVQMVTTGAMTKQLDRLAGMGLIEKHAHPGEGGGVAVLATQRGLELADQAMTALTNGSPLSEMQRSLSGDERAHLARLCEKLLLDFESR